MAAFSRAVIGALRKFWDGAWSWAGRTDDALGRVRVLYGAVLVVGGFLLVVGAILLTTFGLLGAVAIFVGAVAVGLGARAMYRDWRARRRAISLSEERIDLPVAVRVRTRLRARTLYIGEEREEWRMFQLSDCRITNRSQSERMSLGLVVRIPIDDATALVLEEEEMGGMGKNQSFLRCPLNLEPGHSVHGRVGFVLPPSQEERFFGPLTLRRLIEDSTRLLSAELEIRDYVSGLSATVGMPGEYP